MPGAQDPRGRDQDRNGRGGRGARLTRRSALLGGAAAAFAATAAANAVGASFAERARRIAGDGDAGTRAVRLHDHVRDAVLFGWSDAFYAETPDETLAAGRGYCVTKTALFVAACRAADIPARMRFVDIDVRILDGFIDPGTPMVDHAYAEVDTGQGWIGVDSYILDLTLFEAAQARLAQESRGIGYGTRRDATAAWDGATPAFSQFDPSLSQMDFGVFETAAAFHEAAGDTAWNRRTPLLRLVFPFAARRANRRIDALRSQTG